MDSRKSYERRKTRPRSICLVEDDPGVMHLMVVILTSRNYEVTNFADPNQALEHMRDPTYEPDLLLTDFVMPEINGMELLQECIPLKPRMRTLLYSGSVLDDVVHDYDLRPNAFLSKPFDVEELFDLIDHILNSDDDVSRRRQC